MTFEERKRINEAKEVLAKQPNINKINWIDYGNKVMDLGSKAVFITLKSTEYPDCEFQCLQLEDGTILLAGDY